MKSFDSFEEMIEFLRGQLESADARVQERHAKVEAGEGIKL